MGRARGWGSVSVGIGLTRAGVIRQAALGELAHRAFDAPKKPAPGRPSLKGLGAFSSLRLHDRDRRLAVSSKRCRVATSLPLTRRWNQHHPPAPGSGPVGERLFPQPAQVRVGTRRESLPIQGYRRKFAKGATLGRQIEIDPDEAAIRRPQRAGRPGASLCRPLCSAGAGDARRGRARRRGRVDAHRQSALHRPLA